MDDAKDKHDVCWHIMTPPTSTMKTPSVGAPLSASLHLPPKSGFSTEQTAYRLLSANLPTMNRIAIKHAPTAVQAYRTVARPPALATITVPAPTPYVPAARPVVKVRKKLNVYGTESS